MEFKNVWMNVSEFSKIEQAIFGMVNDYLKIINVHNHCDILDFISEPFKYLTKSEISLFALRLNNYSKHKIV